jgi:N-acetylmuramoyl-L-alanine amidase
MKKFKIAYCAGHHLGNPKGVNKSMGFGSIREWTLNDRVADHFAEAAAQYENVELLRTDDPTGETLIDIPERCAAANKWGADLYIDMHHNGGADGTSAGGVVAFSRPNDAKSGAYAEAIYNAVIAAGGLRGNRATPLQTTTDFQTFREADMPAVLMEYGFMDSKVDTPVIVTEAYSVLVAYATMEGIAKAAGLKKKPEEAPAEPEEPDRIYRVQVGAYKVKANAEAMLKKLEAAGFEGFIVSRFASEAAPAPKSIDELAQEVIDGKHGSGEARRESLGEQYEAVQTRVNELLKK